MSEVKIRHEEFKELMQGNLSNKESCCITQVIFLGQRSAIRKAFCNHRMLLILIRLNHVDKAQMMVCEVCSSFYEDFHTQCSNNNIEGRSL